MAIFITCLKAFPLQNNPDSETYPVPAESPEAWIRPICIQTSPVLWIQFIESGSGSSISSESGYGSGSESGSRVLMSKNWKKHSWKLFYILFWSKIAIDLFLGLHKGRPSYRRSHQPSKESIQHFKGWNLLTVLNFSVSFLPSWIRIHNTAKHCKWAWCPNRKRKGCVSSPYLDLLFLVRLPDTYTRELGTENTEITPALFLNHRQ